MLSGKEEKFVRNKFTPTPEQLKALEKNLLAMGYEWAASTLKGVTAGRDIRSEIKVLGGLNVRCTNVRDRIHFVVTGEASKNE
jgi:hypothetical protein